LANVLFPPFRFNISKIPKINSKDKNSLAIIGAVDQLATLISIKENSKSSMGYNLIYAEKIKMKPNNTEIIPTKFFLFIRNIKKKAAHN
jgi:hypothetical protein